MGRMSRSGRRIARTVAIKGCASTSSRTRNRRRTGTGMWRWRRRALGDEWRQKRAEQRKKRRRKLPPEMIQHGHTYLRSVGRPSELDSAAICKPVVIEAQINQVGEIRLTNAHHGIGSAPIDLDGAISL